MKDEAIETINKSRYIYLATMDENGAPRSTIVHGRANEDGDIVWRSSPDTVHSQNIARSGVIGISAYYEDSEAGDSRAVYVSSIARDTGKEKFDEKQQHITHEYSAHLGEYDELQSKPNRLYFKESK